MFKKNTKHSRNGLNINASLEGQLADKAAKPMTTLWPMCKDLDRKLIHKKGKNRDKEVTAHELSLTLSTRIKQPTGLPKVKRRVKANCNARPYDEVIKVLKAEFNEDIFGPSWEQIVDTVESHTVYPKSHTVQDEGDFVHSKYTPISDLDKIVHDECELFSSSLDLLEQQIVNMQCRVNAWCRELNYLDDVASLKLQNKCLRKFKAFTQRIHATRDDDEAQA